MSVLVQHSVKRTLFNMAFPMLAGTFAINAYNLTDAYFVARLGTPALAAMGFTLPVIMLLSCVAGGLGTGVTTLVSHALGRHDHAGAARITTHGLALMLAVTACIIVAGCLSITAIFARLGANAETLPLVRAYMRIWYLGAVFMSLPMLGNGLLISSGDSRSASLMMMVGPLINVALNPLLIFGLCGFPAMGIRGSALATVIAQAVSTTWLVTLLYRKHRLIRLGAGMLAGCRASFRRIAELGIPSVLSMILMPLSAGVITYILGRFGNEAVAAAGAAGRLEMFAFIIPMALGMSLTPFISQNFGANRLDRIHQAMSLATRFALLYGGGIAVVFFVGAPWMATIFSHDPRVTSILITYVRIVAFGYGMMEVHRYCTFVLTGLQHPIDATALNVIRVLVLLIPLSCLGVALGGIRGLFVGRLVTDVVVGSLGLCWVRHVMGGMARLTSPGVSADTGGATDRGGRQLAQQPVARGGA